MIMLSRFLKMRQCGDAAAGPVRGDGMPGGGAVAGPEQVGDGVGGMGGDRAFEPVEVADDGRGLVAAAEHPGRVDRQSVAAAAAVGAEDEEDRARGSARPGRPRPRGTGAVWPSSRPGREFGPSQGMSAVR